MERKPGEFERARGVIGDDLKTLVDDGQALLKASAHATGERIEAARTQFAAHAQNARTRLAELSQPVIARVGRIDDSVRDYTRANPWAALAVAAAAGMLIGLLAAKR